MSKLAEIITRHVEACVAELRAEVEAEIAAAVRSMAPGVPMVERKRAKAKRAAAVVRERRKSKPAKPGSAHTCSECDQSGHNARTCPTLKPPGDETRAQRFARIEAAAAKRNGAAA